MIEKMIKEIKFRKECGFELIDIDMVIIVVGTIVMATFMTVAIIAITKGATVDNDIINPANPASPVRQLLHQTTGF